MGYSHICNVIVSDKDDFVFLKETISKYPCNVILAEHESFEYQAAKNPTIYIGWDFFKNKIPNISILDGKINGNEFWSFSKKENQDEFMCSIDKFIYYAISNWLPSEIVHFDPIYQEMDGFSKILNNGCKNYVYYNNGGLYINNCDRNFVFNVKNLELIHKNPKDVLSKFLNSIKIIGFSYSNILECCEESSINDFVTIEDLCWIKFGTEITEKDFFNLDIPNFEIWKYIPFLMSKLNSFDLSDTEESFLRRIQKKNRITYKLSNTYIAFDYKFNPKGVGFIFRNRLKYSKFKFSNKRTVTGRIVSKDNYNLQNIPKDSEDRKFICSSFYGGKIVVFDYKSFETRIATYLTCNEEFIMEYYDKDIHHETAISIFERIDVTDEQRNFAKTINHALLYGAGDSLIYSKLDSLGIDREKLYEIKSMLKPILDMSIKLGEKLKQDGFLINSWGSIIKPNKSYAAFNNYIQTAASEIITDKIFDINQFFIDKKSRILFQIHDSIIFDFHPSEIEMIADLKNIMTNASGMFFPVSIKIGNNYKEIE